VRRGVVLAGTGRSTSARNPRGDAATPTHLSGVSRPPHPVPHCTPAGDEAIDVALPAPLDTESARRAVVAAGIAGVRDAVAGMARLLVHYDGVAAWALAPDAPSAFDAVVPHIVAALRDVRRTSHPPRLVELPACYDADLAPDLADVAARAGLAAEDVIARHLAGEYVVGLVGFLPGFAYLDGLDPALALPRRATPRTRVPAGSVGLADRMTAVYPSESPGGWHLIARVPLAMFDPAADPPARLARGDRVRFVRVDRARFDALARGDT
jgi:KipI family sensor histidine kinase inhibitor